MDNGEYVRGFRGYAANEGLCVAPVECGGDVLAANGLYDVDGGLAAGLPGDDSRQQGQVSSIVDDEVGKDL